MGDRKSLSRLSLALDPTSAKHASTKDYVDLSSAIPEGIWEYGKAREWATTEQINIFCYGSSTMWGTPLSADLDRSLVNSLGKKLRGGEFAGATGGRGKFYGIPSINAGTSTVTDLNGYTSSGTLTDFAPGLQTRAVSFSGGAWIQRVVADCTGFQVLFQQGGSVGQFQVSLDGGAAITVTPATDKHTVRADGVWTSALLSRGSHTIRITAVGTVIFQGLYAFDGENAGQATAIQSNPSTLTGIRLINGAYGGTTAATFGGSGSVWRTVSRWAATFDPRLFIVMVGSNDWGNDVDVATYKANMRTSILQMRASVPGPAPFLLLHQYMRYTATDPDPWSSFGDALNQLSQEIPDVAYFDLSAHFPLDQSKDWDDLIHADGYHPTRRGHEFIAGLVAKLLQRSMNYGSAPLTPLTTVGPDPSTLSGLVSAWRASDLAGADGSAVSTWSPYAGSQSVALVQATSGNQPTIVRPGLANGPTVKTVTATTKYLRSTAAWSSVLTGALTVLVVAKAGSPALTPYGALFDGRVTTRRVAARQTNNNQLTIDALGTTETPFGGGQCWQVYCFAFNGASSVFQTNYLDPVTLSALTLGANYGLDGITLGAAADATLPLDAEYAEILVFNRQLDATERANSIAYLARKYAIDGAGKTMAV